MQRDIKAKVKVAVTLRNIVPDDILSLTDEDVMNNKIDKLVDKVQNFISGNSPIELEIEEAYAEAEDIYVNGYYTSIGTEEYYPPTRWEPGDSEITIEDDLFSINEDDVKKEFPSTTSIEIEQSLDYDSIEEY